MYVYRPSRRAGIRNEPPSKNKGAGTSDDLFIPTTLRSLQEQDLLLHDGVVLEHAERAVRTGTDHRAIEAGHGHGDEAHGDGARLDCVVRLLSVYHSSVAMDLDLDFGETAGAVELCGRLPQG